MKRYFIIGSLFITAFMVLVTVTLNRANKRSKALEDRAALVCRLIGDQLQRHAGDNRLRVLPVQELENGVYQLEFKNSFTFIPDTLVKVVQMNVASSGLPEDYTVNVFQCNTDDIVYGFQIDPNQKDIVPCLGRDQATGCYKLQIAFADLSSPLLSESETSTVLIIILGICILAISARFYFVSTTQQTSTTNNQTISIGNCQLHFDHQMISNGFGTVELSKIETKLLTILAKEQNQLISRERLLKEVWEDDGVFTSRSLDMFISKLRKKFKNDESVRLTNIYGKGYKLEVG